MYMKKMIHAFVCAVFVSGCTAKTPTNWSMYKSQFNDQFVKELNDNNVSSAAYAVFTKDSVIFSGANTHTNLSAKANLDTKYLIGSVTKVFTAVAVMQLHERRQLNIDDPVSLYLPEFNIKQRFPASGPITIRDVLTHHAGLPSDIFLHKFSSVPQNYHLLLSYLNQHTTCFPVGQIKSYSNLGYALLGILVEKVSGKPYADYVQENIFTPIGMTNSGFYTSFQLQKTLSTAHNKKAELVTEWPIYDLPAGGIYASTSDMIKFGRSFIDKKSVLLSQKTIELMFQLQNKDVKLDLDDRSAICLNFKNKTPELGRILEHGGATVYHRAQLYIAPDAGLAAVMLSDSPDGTKNSWKLNEELMLNYAKFNHMKIAAKANQDKQIAFTSIKAKQLRNFAGDYCMPGMICNLSWKNENLAASIQDNDFYIVPQDDHAFVGAKRILGFMAKSKKTWLFLEDIAEEKLLLQAMEWGDIAIVGQQVKDKKQIPNEWKTRMGKYQIINQPNTELKMIDSFELVEKNGFIVLKYKYNAVFDNSAGVEMALSIASENQAYTRGLGAGGGECVKFDKSAKGRETFLYCGLELQKID